MCYRSSHVDSDTYLGLKVYLSTVLKVSVRVYAFPMQKDTCLLQFAHMPIWRLLALYLQYSAYLNLQRVAENAGLALLYSD